MTTFSKIAAGSLLLFALLLNAVPLAHAEGGAATTDVNNSEAAAQAASAAATAAGATPAQASAAGDAAKVPPLPGGAGTVSTMNCSSFTGVLSDFGSCVMNGIGYAIFTLTGALLSVVGWFFNVVVVDTVFQFGGYFGTSAGLLAGWGVLRDIANIALLFGFIFMGIATILDIHGYEVKKTLPRLIIFAVLLNFSLLASTVIIDTSNLFASVLYSQTSNCTGGTNCNIDNGVSGIIMKESGVSSIYHLSSSVTAEKKSPGFTFYILLALFELVLMVVLIAGAVLLLIRGIVLVFLMVLSPVGFAGLAIPPLEKYAQMWWSKLLSQSFFAPVFLLLLFIGLSIGGALSTTSGGGTLADLVSGGGVALSSLLLIFALMIGFMIGALMIAKQMGVMGAGFATKMAGAAIGGVVIGGAASVGRRTIGRPMNWAAERIQKSEFGRTSLGRLTHSGLMYGAKSSFDARAAGLTSAGSIELGKAGGKDGYHGTVHAGEEARVKYSKNLKHTETEERAKTALKVNQAVEAQQLTASHRAAQEPLKNQIAAKRAEASTATGEAKRNAEQELGNLLAQQQALRSDHSEERTAMEGRHKIAMQNLEQAPQREYAHNLEAGPQALNIPVVREAVRAVYQGTAGPKADHHAAATILKELNKSENQKLIDALRANTEAQSHGDHGGGHAPAAAPHPIAGGAPAAGGGGDHH